MGSQPRRPCSGDLGGPRGDGRCRAGPARAVGRDHRRLCRTGPILPRIRKCCVDTRQSPVDARPCRPAPRQRARQPGELAPRRCRSRLGGTRPRGDLREHRYPPQPACRAGRSRAGPRSIDHPSAACALHSGRCSGGHQDRSARSTSRHRRGARAGRGGGKQGKGRASRVLSFDQPQGAGRFASAGTRQSGRFRVAVRERRSGD